MTISELFCGLLTLFSFIIFLYAKCKSEIVLSQTQACGTNLRGHALLHVTVNAATDTVHHGENDKNEQVLF